MKTFRRVKEGWLRARAGLWLHGDPGRPRQVHISPTDRCNLRCQQCQIWALERGQELTLAEWRPVIDQLAELCGPAGLNFAGGEPLLRDDLPDLIQLAVKAGFSVSANTNGTLLGPRMARRLFESGLDILYVSLDGATAETHDWLRNQPGTYARVMEGLTEVARYPRPRVVLASILHKRSVTEVDGLLELVKSRGYQIVFQPLYQTFGEPFQPEWYRQSRLLPQAMGEVDRALDRLIAERQAGGPVCNDVAQLEAFRRYFRGPTLPNGLSCRAGFADLALDAFGNMLMCFHLAPVGNVRERGVAALWWSREAAERRQEVSGCRRTCNLQNCNFKA